MDETAAQGWVEKRFGGQQVAKLGRFVELLIEASREQNLIAPSTIPAIWTRHIVDSLQLLTHAPVSPAKWLDIGAGAGLPGVPIAIASEHKVTLAEPRALRVAFLRRCVSELELDDRIAITQNKAQNVPVGRYDVISARAVTTTAAILDMSRDLADEKTTFILPKGVSAAEDVYKARRDWAGTFHVEPSIVDKSSGIIIASGVRRK